jgi:UDP-GlcNAc:undecaprenyl-phosphate/decaprenyl-phosphate GlcNAc-1-phosphate transferase
MSIYIIVGLLAAVVVYLSTPVVRFVAVRNGIYSPLRDRDVHTVMMPRLGGVGMFLGLAVGLLVASQTVWIKAIFHDSSVLWAILGGAFIILVVGVIDDITDLNSLVKFGGQVLGALVVALWGPRLRVLPLGPIEIHSVPLQIILTVFVLVLTMNAINFIDGLDGLAAGVAAIGGVAFFVTAYWVHRSALLPNYTDLATLLMAIMVGICIGFLPYNFYPAKIFMGDSGSMLLGLILASGSVVAAGQISSGLYDRASGLPAFMPIILPLAVISLPLVDLSLAVVRRTAAGRSPFSPDRGHLHHKLLDFGYTQRQAVVVMYIWTAFIAFGGAAYAFMYWVPVTIFNIIVLPVVGFLTMNPWLRQNAGAAADATSQNPALHAHTGPLPLIQAAGPRLKSEMARYGTDAHDVDGEGPALSADPAILPSPLLRRLNRCVATVTCVSVLASFIALNYVGVVGIYSIMTATLAVIVAFSVSLIVLHFVVAPSVAVAGRTLLVGMMIKIVALATVVIWLQTPRWVNHDWYQWGIVVAAAAWVAAEVLVFVHQRNAVRAHMAGTAEGA